MSQRRLRKTPSKARLTCRWRTMMWKHKGAGGCTTEAGSSLRRRWKTCRPSSLTCTKVSWKYSLHIADKIDIYLRLFTFSKNYCLCSIVFNSVVYAGPRTKTTLPDHLKQPLFDPFISYENDPIYGMPDSDDDLWEINCDNMNAINNSQNKSCISVFIYINILTLIY